MRCEAFAEALIVGRGVGLDNRIQLTMSVHTARFVQALIFRANGLNEWADDPTEVFLALERCGITHFDVEMS